MFVGRGEDNAGIPRALLWNDDDGAYRLRDLGVPEGFLCSAASAVFSNGLVEAFGYVRDASETEHAWSWYIDPSTSELTDGPLSALVVDLPLNVMLERPSAVDQFGNVAGWYMTSERSGTHAFALVPLLCEPNPDLNGDGRVDLLDYHIFLGAFEGPAP